MKLPALTTEQMAEVDRLIIEEYGILLIQMMENAGLYLADISVPPGLYRRLGLSVDPIFTAYDRGDKCGRHHPTIKTS